MVNDMIAQSFFRMLELAIGLSPVILLALLISPKLSKRFHPRVVCLLWLIVAVRMLLILPVNLQMDRQIYVQLPLPVIENDIPPGEALEWTREPPVSEQENVLTSAPVTAASEGNDEQAEIQAQLPPTSKFPWAAFWMGLWLIGATIVLGYQLFAYTLARRSLGRWKAPVTQAEAVLFIQIKRELGIKAPILLYRSHKAASPIFMGLVKPVIFLPPTEYTPVHLVNIFRHELIHYKHGHLWYKGVMMLLNAMYWFHPLVWWMCSSANHSLELACDSAAIKGYDRTARKEYGYTVLMSMNKNGKLAGSNPFASSFASNPRQVMRRFEQMMVQRAKKKGRWVLVLAVILTLFGGMLVGCGGALQPDGQGNVPSSQEPDVLPADEGDERGTRILSMDLDWPVDTVKSVTFSPASSAKHMSFTLKGDDPVLAVYEGVVEQVDTDSDSVEITVAHVGELSSHYCFNGEAQVQVGDAVEKGQAIGIVGDGPDNTLTFWLRQNGEVLDILNHLMPTNTTYLSVATSNGLNHDQWFCFTTSQWLWPLTTEGRVLILFDGYKGHSGIDIAAIRGSEVVATASGTVSLVQELDYGYGHQVIIDHGDGYKTRYAHCDKLLVEEGEEIEQGQVIATVGSSGNAAAPHLHFELLDEGVPIDPIDIFDSWMTVMLDKCTIWVNVFDE